MFSTVFPAHAGMSRDIPACIRVAHSFPRSRGDEPSAQVRAVAALVFSPLTRG
ncbi:hypothetical protein HMPREF1978_01879 [Actinomyces graevenitzii F0530]|uniref:Uncharacterized protein n=1 Tax=Actinomyces graevenitzii F0530 TaxID=1321817 RepID=U1PBU4_9ACTO|nr:hypothetical protein HMPREF1978_01879 [Actinomyces graevenitzii F0530]